MPTPAPVSLRRLDSRFLLPEWPRTVRVVGDVPGWHAALPMANLATPPDGDPPDLVVAQAAQAGLAVLGRPPSLLLFGRPTVTAIRSAGYAAEPLLALPDTADPRALVPRAQRQATSYVFSHWLPGSSRRSQVRNRLASTAARAGALPRLLPEICMATRRPGVPAIVRAAVRGGLLAAEESLQWFLGSESGADYKRLALFVLPEGSRRPTHLVKFDRRHGASASTEREAAGLDLVRRTGGAVATRGPGLVGRFDFHGHDVLVQTGCPGVTLSRVLLGPLGRPAKVAVLDKVVTWLRQVARETARPAGSAGPTADRIPSQIPLVFGHGDLAPGNIMVAGGEFSVVDWELASDSSYPLRDLLYLALHALPLLDGEGEDPSESYLLRLFSGAAPASGLLFDWVRQIRADLSLGDSDVDVLAAACWSHYEDFVAGLREALVATGALPLPPFPVERVAEMWRREKQFRRGWDAWLGPVTVARSA